MSDDSAKITEAPLVSFCVKCFNQKRFILEALKGAFAQAYRPLEIVISDDASNDGSWEIITSAVENYRHGGGDVSIVLNRNETNLGNMGNWLKLCELSNGALLVKADGDDISLPERTEKIVQAWKNDGSKAKVVYHDAEFISPSGRSLGRLNRKLGAVIGAVMALSRETYSRFGTVDNGRIVDDEVFARRASMIGSQLELNEILVRYRLGTGVSSSQWNIRKVVGGCYAGLVTSLEQSMRDLEFISPCLDDETVASWQKRLSYETSEAIKRRDLILGKTYRERKMAAQKISNVRTLSIWGFFRFAFALPRPIGGGLLFCYALVRYLTRLMRGTFIKDRGMLTKGSKAL